MVVSDAIHNIMGGIENTGDVRLHNHRRKLKQRYVKFDTIRSHLYNLYIFEFFSLIFNFSFRFDIVKKLGQGTYGKVQLGINKETGQEVHIIENISRHNFL